jgi:hypothetical protein
MKSIFAAAALVATLTLVPAKASAGQQWRSCRPIGYSGSFAVKGMTCSDARSLVNRLFRNPRVSSQPFGQTGTWRMSGWAGNVERRFIVTVRYSHDTGANLGGVQRRP